MLKGLNSKISQNTCSLGISFCTCTCSEGRPNNMNGGGQPSPSPPPLVKTGRPGSIHHVSGCEVDIGGEELIFKFLTGQDE